MRTVGSRRAPAAEAVNRRLLAAILTGGFAARAGVALVSDNIPWPDELFQYLEQGHRAVFGYGYVPWDFRYAARSWLLPGFIACWLWLCKSLHLDYPAFYVPFVKLVFCALATTLIYSAYRTARNIAGAFAGLIAALLVAGWYELIYFAHKPLTEAVATYLLVAALAMVTDRDPTSRQTFAAGWLAGLATVLRVQYAPCALILGVYAAFRWPRAATARAGSGFALAVLMAGAIDRATWGGWFETFRVAFGLHATLDASAWFGAAPPWWHVGALSVASGGLIWAPLALGWLRRWSLSRLPVACALLIIATHSAVAHKEYRFVLGAIPLAWITAAILIARGRLLGGVARAWIWAVLGVFFAVSAAGIAYRLPGQSRVYPAGPLLARTPALDAYLLLARAADVRGVLAFESPGFRPPFIGTGGYYYLHRDVPVYFRSELEGAGLPVADWSQVVSHIVESRATVPAPGFRTLSQFGDLAVLERLAPGAGLRIVCPPRAPEEAFFDRALTSLALRVRVPATDPRCR